MTAEYLRYDNEPTPNSALQRLSGLMMKMGVDPELDKDPEDRSYVLAYEIKRPGKPINYGILSLEEAAVYCGSRIDEHTGNNPDDNGDESLMAMIRGYIETGATLTGTAAREHARNIGKMMLSIELKKHQE